MRYDRMVVHQQQTEFSFRFHDIGTVFSATLSGSGTTTLISVACPGWLVNEKAAFILSARSRMPIRPKRPLLAGMTFSGSNPRPLSRTAQRHFMLAVIQVYFDVGAATAA